MKKILNIISAACLVFSPLSSGFSEERIVTGEVTAVLGGEIACNRGAESGVREGAGGLVYYLRDVGGRSVRLYIARVEVVSAAAASSRLRILEQTAEIRVGFRVNIDVVQTPETPKQAVPKLKPDIQTSRGKKKWYIIGRAALLGAMLYCAHDIIYNK